MTDMRLANESALLKIRHANECVPGQASQNQVAST